VVIVYELLEEMLDNGFPLATESNILKELIRPPTILRSMVNTITGKTAISLSLLFMATVYAEKLTDSQSSGSSNVGETLPTGQLSTIPWRRAGVKYTNNEAYFDVVEEIDAILDKSGESELNLIFQLDCAYECKSCISFQGKGWCTLLFQELQFLQKSRELLTLVSNCLECLTLLSHLW